MAHYGNLQLTGYGIDTVKIARPVKITLQQADGYDSQFASYFSLPKNSQEIENNLQEINFNGDIKAHQALMDIIGDDTFDINDLNNIGNKVKQYGATIENLNKNDGSVTIKFASGKRINIDFWTNNELKELKENTTSPLEKLMEKTVKGIDKCVQKATPYVNEAGKWMNERMVEPLFKQIDRATERWENYHPFG